MGSIANGAGRCVQTLDFARFLYGDGETRRQFGHDLTECLGKVGFVKLTNHGIGDRDIHSMFDFVRQLIPSRSTSIGTR
jgi:isopenicillin N synthase-like dioxygenase